MPRSTVIGNGSLLVTFDDQLMIRDFYFPHVGLEDHNAFNHFHRIGIFVDNKLSWLMDDGWKTEIGYIDGTLITQNKSTNEKIGLSISFNDFVYPSRNIFIRKMVVQNHTDEDKHIKLYFNQDFHLYGDKLKDTALYDPGTDAVIHYRLQRYFLANGSSHFGGISSYATGKSEYHDLEGTWKDAEDGQLGQNPIDQGSVDSTIEFEMHIKANSSEILYFWICAAEKYDDVKFLNDYILSNTPERLLENTIHYWRSWVSKSHKVEADIPQKIKDLFERSLLIIRTQIDNQGGILAANDSDIMKFNKDTYTYVWPRDGAFVAYALDCAGYGEISKRFYRFCSNIITEDGFLLHKYNPDGSWGSSWHPWIDREGTKILPIQEDGTALAIRSIWHHYERFKDIEFLQEIYNSFVKRAANFLIRYVDKKTGLPNESYDLWEEKRGIFAYTLASVYAGLEAAINIAETLGRFAKIDRYRRTANKMKKAFLEYFYDKKTKRFLRSIRIKDGKVIEKDSKLDASIFNVNFFGLVDQDDERFISTAKQLHERLWVKTMVGGMARYENDYYHRRDTHPEIPGNPWIITTMWYAQWLIKTAKDAHDLNEALKLLEWVADIANNAGILAEQYHPFTGEALSVAPLTWSHATFVETLILYDKKWHQYNIPLGKEAEEFQREK